MSAVDELVAQPAPIADKPVEPVSPPAALPPTNEPQPKVENRPLLMLYRDAAGKHHVLIAGNGNGSWLLPKADEVAHEDLDKQAYTLTPKTAFNIIDFGAAKPTITVKHHEVFSWVSLDLAKTILGSQFEQLIPKDIEQEIVGKVPTHTAPIPTHSDTCSGCDSCKPVGTTPKPAALAGEAQHMGVSEPTASMLAMHGTKTTHIGATI